MSSHAFRATVISIEEKFANGAAVKDANGDWTVPQRSLGWFVRISESSSVCVGDKRPNMAAGDAVRITLEKIDDREAQP